MSSGADPTGVPPVGTVIAEKYRVESVLGSGGMGCVVKADHLLMRKPVAVKFLQADTSGLARGRLFREARATQALSSENVVRVFDLGVHERAPYIVMELLEGTDLAARVQDEGPLGVEEAVDCLLEACVAVTEAHAVGIIHRDIKPGNLFLTRTPTQELVKVLDFGISKVPETAGGEDCEKTAEDVVLGTPYYMSPEQLRNPAKIDARTDVWALAVTLFYMLSGKHPFEGETPREVTAAIFTDPPLDLRVLRPSLPEPLCLAVADGLVKRPDDRTPSVPALVRALVPFASKRGRLAAERVEAMRAPPPRMTTTTRTARAVPMTTTDAGLASTMPPGKARGLAEEASRNPAPSRDGGKQTAPPSDAARSMPARTAGIVVAMAAAVAIAAWLASPRAPAPDSPGSATAASVVASTAREPVARARAGPDGPDAPEPAAPAPTIEPRLGPAAPSASALAAVPSAAVPTRLAPPRPVGSTPRPAASASAAPKTVPPAPKRDIDGVPIVD